MAKGTYLLRLLSVAALFICIYAGSNVLKAKAGVAHANAMLRLHEKESQIERLQAIYRSEVGVRERTGKNDGSRVEEYLRYAGLGKGNPWCSAFVCWTLGKAGIQNPRSGWSPNLFPASKVIWQRGRTTSLKTRKQRRQPTAGDVFGIYFADKGRIAHCGFVDTWNDAWLITVEGNTNESGSREGDGVYKKRRPVASIYKVADWAGG